MNALHKLRLMQIFLLPCLSLTLAAWSGRFFPVTAQQASEPKKETRDKAGDLPDTSQEDSAIIRVMLRRYASSPNQPLLVLSTTEIPFSLNKDEKGASALQKALLERNRVANSLATFDLSFPGTVRFLSRSELDKVFEKGSWEAFHAQYPEAQGYITLTLPGYSSDKKTALVTIDQRIASDAGRGGLVRLTKKNGTWQEAQTHLSWRY